MTIQRIVCFKFQSGTSDADKAKHMASFAALKDAIPEIRGYSGGYGLSGDHGAAPEYDTLHYMTFASMDDVDAYFAHEAHQQFVKEHKHMWVDALVLNADMVDRA